MLPKAYLISHSRMSGSRWVTTALWFSESLRLFLHISMYSCHLFLVSSVSVRSFPFLSFILPIFAWNGPLMSPIFLKRSLVFFILLFSSIYLHCSFKKAFLSLLTVLWNSAFNWVYLSLSPLPFISLLSSAACKASSDSHFTFLHFFWGDGFGHWLMYNVTNLHPQFFRHSTRSNHLNLFITSTVQGIWFRSYLNGLPRWLRW